MNKEIFVYAGWTEEKPELIGVDGLYETGVYEAMICVSGF